MSKKKENGITLPEKLRNLHKRRNFRYILLFVNYEETAQMYRQRNCFNYLSFTPLVKKGFLPYNYKNG